MTKNDLLEGFLLKEENKPEYQQQPINISDNYTQASMEGLLKDLQDGKIMSMKEVITDIEELIDERQRLKTELFKDVDAVLMNINNFLTTTGDKIDAIEQLKLKEKLLDIENFKLNEKVNAFRDIALLKKELRDRMQEYKDKQTNVNVIDQLLQD